MPRVVYRQPIIAEEECVCNVSELSASYSVTTDCYMGTAIIESDLIGDTCYDVQWNGQDDLGLFIVGMDFLSPFPEQWQIGFNTGEVLYKVPGSGPAGLCDIASPIGTYVGDGCTATVF